MAHAVWETGIYTTTGEISGPVGSAHRLAAPYEAFATADGFIVVGVATQKIWTKFCDALDLRHLETDPLFATEIDRIEHRDSLKVQIEDRLGTELRLGTGSIDCWPKACRQVPSTTSRKPSRIRTSWREVSS